MSESAIVVPFVVYLIYPPELKKTPMVVDMARDELRKLGPLSYGEWVMAATFVVLLIVAPARPLTPPK